MSPNPHIVFYDDQCPLCNAEIEHYKKIKPRHAIEWLGIEAAHEKIRQYGLNKTDVLKRLHAIDSQGRVVSGAAAFVLIWNSLEYYRLLGFIVTRLRLIPVLDFFYGYFTRWRLRKNKTCAIK